MLEARPRRIGAFIGVAFHPTPDGSLLTDSTSAFEVVSLAPHFDSLQLHSFLAPSADVLSFYAAADAYVAPSLGDAFGLPILEAMACGLPVIASVQAGASENIIDGTTGYLLRDPMNHVELAELIRRLAVDRSAAQKLGTAAAQYVQASVSWDRNAAATREFLENPLASRQI